MRNYSLALLLSLFVQALLIGTISSQALNPDHVKGIKARNIGPAGMSGRITAIDVDLSNPQRIFVGAASGGVWLSTDGGITWKPIFDDQPNIAIGAIKINQRNPSEIWVGTGEGNPRNSQNSGAGIFKSVDGGRTWAFKGLKNTKTIHRIIIDESRDGVVYVGAHGAAWGASPDRGLFKTTDGGESWSKILYVNDQTGIGDMVIDPSNPNKLIVAMYEHSRKPWTFTSGGPGSGLYITHDGGKNWRRVEASDGLPKGELGRIGLAIGTSNPNYVYALVEAKDNALYKSTDGGVTWSMVTSGPNLSDRPFYYHEIYVDPSNEDRLYSLYTYLSTSTDGGRTWKVIADYGNNVHPDHHAFWISPHDPNFLINGNDGGLNISYDMGNNWRFINNLPVGQFYHVSIDDEFPYNVYGGMQDNGSWAGPGFVLRSGGITNYDWQEVFFGDGFDVTPKPDDPNLVYAMSQGGNIGLVDRTTGVSRFIKPLHPDNVKLRFNWNAPLALDPTNTCGLYYGSQFVHYSADCGKSWTILSGDLTTNDTTKQKQHLSGGLTIDATSAENNTTIIAIAPHPTDFQTILVGTDDGRLQITTDRGTTWQDIYRLLPQAPSGGWIPQIEWSLSDENEAFVVLNNYRQNDWSAYLYHTRDKGKTWKRIVNDSQVASFTLSIVQDKEEPRLLFLGTDVGLYFSINRGSTWHKWVGNLPHVQIQDMKIQPTFGDLVMGTFGRAFWVIDDIGFMRKLASDNFTLRDFAVASVSPAYRAQSRSYQGIRFIGQAEFQGDNKNTNAVFTLWLKPNEGGDKKKEKIHFTILGENGDTIRRFSREVSDQGINRIAWMLETDGIEGPSPRDRKEDSDPPRGDLALPGIYKALIKYGDMSDSINVEVRMDPRLDISTQDIADLKNALKEIDNLTEQSRQLYDKIKAAKKSMSIVQKLTETLSSDLQKDLNKLITDENKKLEDLHALFFNRDNLKGIQRNPEILTGYIGTARRYYMSSYGSPSPNAQLALDKAKRMYEEVKMEVDKYFESDWPMFKNKINETDFKIFED